MLTLIEGLPPDVLGVEASGTVTHADYRDVLIPSAEAKMGAGPTKMLYVAGPAFTGYALEALWDDAAFGARHWHRFSRIAVVTDTAWLRAAATMFSPFFPSDVRVFALAEMSAAKDWISHDGREGA